jgi:PD-(D/E)XK nuclease superfamily
MINEQYRYSGLTAKIIRCAMHVHRALGNGVDFLVEGVISVELKARTQIEEMRFAQAINYLEAYKLEVGLLINFGERTSNFKRFANKKYRPSS